ncbi:MAG: DEAD/DEAH box helicase, partial [Thiotrichaceae bacterium]|nr:DEAD/DEAH box helicase [Thiotrichaceae bacterium]
MAVSLTIAKHSVARTSSGLSPLQQALLTDPAKVRIVDAPTGAGKTYAFQKGLIAYQQRILFIVPTRRLAQNIAAGLMNDLVEEEGWSSQLAEKKVAVWSSDETIRLREEGIDNIRGYRIRQWQGLDSTTREGEMIIAIPEVLSYLLIARSLDCGHAGMGVFDVLDGFDHIVFDEFHSIESRGFGMAALFAKLAPYFGSASVSFLSATPVNIKPVLLALGVAEENIKELKETLVDDADARPLHGDVKLSFSDDIDLKTVINQQLDLIQKEARADRQVVIIYNALGTLRRDLEGLAKIFSTVGIDPDQVLVINSIDDSGRNHVMRCGFHTGKHQKPDDYSILIATASIEMGVTFRQANTMIMEAGFEPMNFLQRYGRAARRGEDGQVFVCIDSASELRNSWQREIKNWAKLHQNSRQSIQDLTAIVSKTVEQQASETEQSYFGDLDKHAIYTAGLYWQVLINHKSNQGHRKPHLLKHQPKSSKTLFFLIKTVRQLEKSDDYKRYCEKWLQHLFAQALRYRDIGKRVIVIENSGRQLHVSRLWLERETNILSTGVWQEDEQGNEIYPIDSELDDYLLDDKKRASRELETYFPHSSETQEITSNAGLVNQWCRLLKKGMDAEYALEDYPDAMQAAEKIVRLTGLVPSDESVFS